MNPPNDLSLLNLEIVRLLELHARRQIVWKVEHNVVDVDVTVENVLLVQLIQSVSNLDQDALDFILLQRGLTSRYDVVQGPAVDVLLHEDVLALILEKFYQCHACARVYLF